MPVKTKERNVAQSRYEQMTDPRRNGTLSSAENQSFRNIEQGYYDDKFADIMSYNGMGPKKDYSGVSDQSEPMDQSQPTDQSNPALSQAEQKAGSAPVNSGETDLGKQERGSFETSGFNEKSESTGKVSSKGGFGRFKKGVAFAGIGVIILGAGALGGFTLISGPMQLIQASEAISDFTTNLADNIVSARTFRNNKSLAQIAHGGSMSERVRSSRLGLMGNFAADKTTKRLESQGITFDSKNAGISSGVRIDYGKYNGVVGDLNDPDVANATKAQMTATAKEMGLSDSEYKITIDPKSKKAFLDVTDDLPYSKAKKVVYNAANIGKWDIIGKIKTRLVLKKMGFLSAFHPIKKAERKAIKSLLDFMKKSAVLKKFAGKVGNVDLDKSFKRTMSKINEALPGNFDLTKLTKIFTSGLSKGIADIISVVCTIDGLRDTMGAYKMMNVVNVAIAGSNLIKGYAAQIKSGDDIDMDQAGYAAQTTMGDMIPQIGEDGQPIKDATGKDKKVYSSFWNSDPVCVELGYKCNTAQNVPEELTNVGEGGFTLFGPANSPINSFLSALLDNPVVGFLCTIDNALGAVMGALTSWFVEPALGLLMKSNFLQWVMARFNSMLYGAPLDLASVIPEEWGGVGMFGGTFSANQQMIGMGGRKVSKAAAKALKEDNREFLAWQQSQKSLVARLFDPSDYNSALSQIAIVSGMNTSSTGLGTQIGNVFKLFTSAPTLIAQSASRIGGGNAYASSNYDYNIDTYSYTLDEVNTIDREGTGYDLFDNADKVIEQLKNEDDHQDPNAPDYVPQTYHTYADKCLAAPITRYSSYDVKPRDNKDGTAWNYVDYKTNKGNQFQYEKYKGIWVPCYGDDGPLPLRTYVMDYFTTLSSACFEGGDGDSTSTDACAEVGVGSSDSSSDGGTGGNPEIDGSGNSSAEGWQKKFADETHGQYGDYKTWSNGCTTISAWFIGAHTTLTYGHGNGGEVVGNLVAANPGKNLQITNKPTKAPALFSSYPPDMGAVSEVGHVGLVTQIDPDGTIHTLESGANSYMNGFSYPWSRVNTHPASDYASGRVQFVYIGDYLK